MLEDQLPAKDQGYNEHSNYYHGKHKAKQRIWAHVIVSHLKRSERKWFYQFGNTLLCFVAMTLPILFYKKSAIYHQFFSLELTSAGAVGANRGVNGRRRAARVNGCNFVVLGTASLDGSQVAVAAGSEARWHG